ncbi:chitinase-like protein [Euroglyphus maynei]|uniref:Chitinase-like protein n=1 Tax=Euroglyphus maynei TaxID=6958 RepID=A0A1Y3BTK3_EURMA|nr:chitinase-like protein [Euroglyphus maynei]
MAINRNPENLLQLYRPRFKNRKRFRKIRLPNGYRFIRKDNNNTTNDTDFSVGNQPSSSLTTMEEDISDFVIKQVENNEILRQTTPIIPETKSLNSINDSVITTTMEPPLTTNSSINIIPAKNLINTTVINNNNRTNNFKVFCTYDAYRSIPLTENDDNRGRYFDIEQLENNSMYLKYCTHLIYAFANIDLNGELYTGSNTIQQQDSLNHREYNRECLIRFQKLKQNNPDLRLLIAVGGWDTPPQLFSLMVATGKLRERLSGNIYKFVLENGFDGAIIAWFYPVYGSKSSMDSRSTRATSHSMFQFNDKQNLIKFVRSMRKKFDSISLKNRLELGLMVPPFQDFIDRGYDAKKLAE